MKSRGPITKGKLFAEALNHDRRYLEAVTHAVELYDDPENVLSTLRNFLSRKCKGDFCAANPYSKRLWFESLIDAYSSSGLVDRTTGDSRNLLSCFLVTFTHREWVFPHTHIAFDLERAKQKIRNAMGRFSFIGCFEVALYVNEQWQDDAGNVGDLVCFHCHAVVWAKNKYQTRALGGRVGHRFEPILGNTSGMNFKSLKTTYDVSRTIRYQAKMPYWGYRTFQEHGKTKQRKAKLSARRRYFLFQALKGYDLLDFWLAGGEGAKIIRKARASLSRYRAKARADHFRPLHNGRRTGAGHLQAF